MYTVIAYDNPTDRVGRVIFDPRIRKNISAGSLNLKESDIDDFQLTVNQNNMLFGNVKPLMTHIEVKKDDKIIFRGRALKPKREMISSGQFMQSFSFESISAYLLDSVQRFKEVHDTTVSDFFKTIIDVHNSQVPDYKKFKVGKVTVTNSTDNVYRFIDYTDTLSTIQDKLIDRLGGYLQIRFESDGNYIDYLNDVGVDHINDNPIQIGKNLQSASVEIDPTSVITRLVPLGATIESDSEDTESEVSKPRITIASVNSGKDYLDIPNLQKEFGIINGSQVWDDVTQPANLLSKAKNWIASQTIAVDSWSITAVEIGLNNLSGFNVSDRYKFVNQAVAEPQMLRVVNKTIDLLSPHKSSLEIGAKQKKITDYQKQIEQKIDDKTQESKDKAVQLFGRMHTIVNLKGKEQTEALAKLGNDLGLKQTNLQNNLDALLKQIAYIDSTVTDVSNWINSTGTSAIQAYPNWSSPQSLRAVNSDGSAMVFNANGLGYYSNNGLVRSAIDSQGRIVAESITGGTITGVTMNAVEISGSSFLQLKNNSGHTEISPQYGISTSQGLSVSGKSNFYGPTQFHDAVDFSNKNVSNVNVIYFSNGSFLNSTNGGQLWFYNSGTGESVRLDK